MTSKTYILIDFENRPIKSLAPIEGSDFQFVLLHTKNNKPSFDLLRDVTERPGQVEVINVGNGGNNALDFCLVLKLGELAALSPESRFFIVAGDKGYAAATNLLRLRGMRLEQVDSLEALGALLSLEGATSGTGSPKLPAGLATNVDKAINKLRSIRENLPKTKLKLFSTIAGSLGATKDSEEVRDVYDALVKRGIVGADSKVIAEKLGEEKRAKKR